MSGHEPAEPGVFLEQMQALARLALERWELDVASLTPISDTPAN